MTEVVQTIKITPTRQARRGSSLSQKQGNSLQIPNDIEMIKASINRHMQPIKRQRIAQGSWKCPNLPQGCSFSHFLQLPFGYCY